MHLRRELAKLATLFRQHRPADELAEEIRTHLEMEERENLEAGMSPEEGHYAALRRFGNVLLTEERSRKMWGWSWVETLGQDMHFALRMVRKSPGFTLVAMLTLALGIGANTAIFSVVNGVLLQPLPYPEPSRLVALYETGKGFPRGSVAYPNLQDWRRESHSFTDIAAYRSNDVILTGSGQPEHLLGEHVSAGFFAILGVAPRLGRTFLPQEDLKGSGGTVVLTYGLWRRRFGSDPHILGKTLTVNNLNSTVVGVLPADFRFRDYADLYIPVAQWRLIELDDRLSHPGLTGVARLKPGVTLAAAQAEMTSIARHLSEQYPRSNAGRGVALVPMKKDMVENIRPTLFILLGAVAFVLVIACANVANLLLARAMTRTREFAVRAALGAGRGRVIRQLLTESVLLALGGGGLGILLAFVGTRMALAAVPDTLPRSENIGLDPWVLLFTLTVSILAGIFFGLAPAFQGSKTNLQESLKEGARGSGGARHRAEGVFVTVEVALAVVLLAGAGLMMQSIWRLWRVDAGFDTHNLLTAQVALSPSVKGDPSAARMAFRQMLTRISAVPGVRAAALSGLIPLSNNWNDIPYWSGAGPQPPNDQMRSALLYMASPDYLKTMGIPLIAGRFFTEQDTPATSSVVVIDEAMAKHLFPGGDPMGKQINLIVIGPVQIVGVVGHIKQRLDSDDTVKLWDEVYFPFLQVPDKFMAEVMLGVDLMVRTEPEPLSLLPALRAAVAGPALDQPVYGVRTLEQIISGSMAERRLTMMLLITFAATAMGLAAVGIYGVMSYAVGRRAHELGVRMALGASRETVRKLVVREGMILAGSGTVIGLAGALGLTRFLASLLYGVRPTDPTTLVAVALLLGTIALAACCVPAWQAAKVDPMAALRCE